MSEITIYSSGVLEDLLKTKKSDFLAMVKGGETTFKKELAFASQAINASDLLQKADKNSILASVFNIALTGLSLNPITKLAYLTPRYNSKRQTWECILVPSYQGLVKTITDTGSAKKVDAYVVYDGDEFSVEYGSEPKIVHKPNIQRKKDAPIVAAYAVAVLHSGERQSEVMNKEDLDHVKGKSDGYKAYRDGKVKTAIWVEWEGEMSRKTVIKRLVKYLPKTERFEELAKVIDMDNQEYPAEYWQVEKGKQLVRSSAYDEDMRGLIESRLDDEDLTSAEAKQIIFDLENNQLDRINSGLPYSQTDIKKKIAQEA
jgi:recombination protein RecT